ncbi:MAG: class I SAM-dependent methyltransferase [Candidatus Heimdallarchaeota archaeon]|nr:class I SAM-dependent methyltransferase [Candidatus Heimdallarchaeota archaeon]MBY8994571.1 class I SAM-dependent methyltransferase [Candidatus Heimdallarchaeota archaeon]
MKEKSLQVSWDWSKVEDFTYWKIPDGYVMSLPYYIGKPPARIFDLGCGVGRHTVYFASLGYEVDALDLSSDAVKSTQEWLKKDRLKANVYKGKMTDITQPDNHYDLVLAFNVIYHAFKDDMIHVINEIYRIIKPGGFFFGTILTKDPNQPFYDSKGVIDEQTLIKLEEPEKGIPHFFSYTEDVLEFFKEFELKDLYYKEWYRPPYTIDGIKDKKGYGHYILFAQKPEKK